MRIIDGLWVLALTATILLVTSTIILKLKAENKVIDILALVTGVMLLIGATSLVIMEFYQFRIVPIGRNINV